MPTLILVLPIQYERFLIFPGENLVLHEDAAELVGLSSVLRAGLQLHLGELDVPVAILVPHQLVDRFRGQVEAIRGEMACNLGLRALHAAPDPSVSDRKSRRLGWVETDILAVDVHEHESRRVPQLVAEIAIAFAAREIEVERAAEGREAGKGEAHRVGAVSRDALWKLSSDPLLDRRTLLLQHQPLGLLRQQVLEAGAADQVQRIEHVALGLGHFLALLVAHDRIDVHVAERQLAGEIGRHHDHAHDPEKNDVEAGDEYRARQKHFELARLLRPAERRMAPQGGREPGVEHVGVLPERAAGLPDFRDASSTLRATTMLPCSSYQAGIRCPHQSWREMHQS